MIRPPPRSPLFPYTTLSRSPRHECRDPHEHRTFEQAAVALGAPGEQSARHGQHDELGEQGDQKVRSEEHTSELQSRSDLVCRLLLEKKKSESDNNGKPTIII